jgi:glutamine synthetase
VNSYRRLAPGFEAPINMVSRCVHCQRARDSIFRRTLLVIVRPLFASLFRIQRSVSVAKTIYLTLPQARRLEFRTPDGSANPFLAFPAILMAV